MPRKLRIEKIGFYHIINRGVARANIFLSDDDYVQFLQIMQDASQEYGFAIYSFCLMSNHYHLLLKISDRNLSILMQNINSRYSIYFNHKYKRVGPLWQGRFKSWYLFDTSYLQTLIKYIEYNPIKANITQDIGEYPWAMSSRNATFFSHKVQSTRMLNFELLDGMSFDKELNEDEQKKLNTFLNVKFELKEDELRQKEKFSLESYFGLANSKESAIHKALKDGYTQREVGEYLGLSHVAVSKIAKIYRQKVNLFEKLRDKGIFWSYSKSVSYEDIGSGLFVEYLLKYGDFDDIKLGFELFGKRYMKKIWEKKLTSDKSFIKTNLMLARVFFGMDVESDYFKEVKNARLEKLKLLAS
ncbi:transposase [Sulfurospirillum sp. SCADC]|uniref:transposase n=1 Tax=Sulfurospirillum sp. SCADC TaxID=1537915 RepID=UPI00068C4DE5|nr:transposase [Sulfurospirillum sp. SCADC]